MSINPQDREVVERACALIAGYARLEAHKHATHQEVEQAKNDREATVRCLIDHVAWARADEAVKIMSKAGAS